MPNSMILYHHGSSVRRSLCQGLLKLGLGAPNHLILELDNWNSNRGEIRKQSAAIAVSATTLCSSVFVKGINMRARTGFSWTGLEIARQRQALHGPKLSEVSVAITVMKGLSQLNLRRCIFINLSLVHSCKYAHLNMVYRFSHLQMSLSGTGLHLRYPL